MKVQHFISLKDFSKKEFLELINLSLKVKKKPWAYKNKLAGKSIGLLFQKPSLRTKTSFYLGARQLGAEVIYYTPDEVKIGQREKISDVAKTLSCYLDGIVLRTFSHAVIEEFSSYAGVSVINALSNLSHPSQVLGDLATIYELGRDVKKIKFAYIGDGNNVCHSLLYAFSILGGNIHIAAAAGYEPDSVVCACAKSLAQKSGAEIYISNNVEDAVKGADVVYTDVWASMGDENERQERKTIFQDFQINDKVMSLAKKDCLVMHCLPAHRGEEITDSVIDGDNSIVFLQAQNRLHSAKAVLLYVLGKKGTGYFF